MKEKRKEQKESGRGEVQDGGKEQKRRGRLGIDEEETARVEREEEQKENNKCREKRKKSTR